MAHMRRLFWRLFPPYLFIILLVLLSVTFYTTRTLRQFHNRQVRAGLEARTQLIHERIADALAVAPETDLNALVPTLAARGGVRITLIDEAGVVLADSEHKPAEMRNHSNRPEYIAAVRDGQGFSSRRSPTLQENMMYFALPLQVGYQPRLVVRTALLIADIDAAFAAVYRRVLWASAVTAVLAAALSLYVARRISRPIEQIRLMAGRLARGDLEAPMPRTDALELAALADTLSDMARRLNDRIHTVTTQRNEFEAVLAAMVEGVWAVDAQGRIISMNQAAADLFGVEADKATGLSAPEIVRNAALQKFVEQTLASDAPTEADIALARPGQGERFFSLHGAALTDNDGVKRGAVIVLHDVTRLRRLENVRRDFAANVSHELKTPITSLKGFVETLREGAVDDPQQARRFLEIIARQTDRLHAIVEDLLSLSRLEAEREQGRFQLTMAPVKPVLEAALELSQIAARKRNISLKLTCPDSLEAPINAAFLEQAVVNLVDNAIKYSTEGQEVDIAARVDNGALLIDVQDRGCGIAAENQERIFERFYVIDKARSKKLGGTGLGLAIVKHVAQAHGGGVSVRSTPYRGSTFTIALPPQTKPDSSKLA